MLRFSIPEKLGVVAVSHDVRRRASDFVPPLMNES